MNENGIGRTKIALGIAAIGIVCIVVAAFYMLGPLRREAEFEVSNLSIVAPAPETIYVGTEVEISVEVSNVGGRTGNHTVTLLVNDTVEATVNVSLSGGESMTVSFKVVKAEAGTCLVEVAGLSGSFVVEMLPVPPLPPFLDNLVITPEGIELGDNVTISFDIVNTDSQSITYGVDIHIENVNEPPPIWPPYNVRIWVELAAYEFKTVSHTLTMDTVGDFNVTIIGMTGSFKVVSE